jgi:hypothetical protein
LALASYPLTLSRANPAMTSFTPVHHEADWVLPGQTHAWQRPFLTLR